MNNSRISVNLFSLFIGFIIIYMADQTSQQASTFECGRAYNNRYPWMAHIQIRPSTDSQLFVCGGTLISDEHVLTAAHCLQDDNSAVLNTILNITLGSNRYTNIYEDFNTHQIFGMKSVAIQSNWNLESDIAIITLLEPANFTDYVQPACLPFEDDSDHVYEMVDLAGWGVYDESNIFSSFLHWVWSRVIPSVECQRTAGNFSGANVICSVELQYHERYYYGDDGGPMINFNYDCERYFVIGIFGKGEYFNDEKNKPNVFTRVRAQLDFIRSQTGVASPIDCPTTIQPSTDMPTTTEALTTDALTTDVQSTGGFTPTDGPTTGYPTTITETTTQPTSPTTILPPTTDGQSTGGFTPTEAPTTVATGGETTQVSPTTTTPPNSSLIKQSSIIIIFWLAILSCIFT